MSGDQLNKTINDAIKAFQESNKGTVVTGVTHTKSPEGIEVFTQVRITAVCRGCGSTLVNVFEPIVGVKSSQPRNYDLKYCPLKCCSLYQMVVFAPAPKEADEEDE